MKVKVWEWQKEEFELDLPETATVERLTREVAAHCNRQVEEVILMLQGRALVDLESTLQAEGVLDYDRISLVIRQGRDSAVQAAISPLPARPPVPLETSPATQIPATAPKTFGYVAKPGGALPFPQSVIPAAPQPAVPQNPAKAVSPPVPLEASVPAKFNPVPAKPSKFGYTGGNLGTSKAKVPQSEEAASELKPAAPQPEVLPAAKPVGFKPIPVAAPSAANTGYKPVAAAPTGTSAGYVPPGTGLKAAPTPSRQFSSPEAVSKLTELGYSHAEVEAALEKAQGDVELAAGYLSSDSGPEGDERLQAGLEQVRTMMRSDPAGFDMMLKSNPQLAAMDAQIPGGLKQFLQSGASFGGRGPGPADNAPLTAADQSNIEQLVNLGFSAEQAKEAYLGCRRNVEMAAEVLLSGG